MKFIFPRFCAIGFAIVQTISAATSANPLVINSLAIGGGSGIIAIGDDGAVTGIVVGQNIGQAPFNSTSSDGATLLIRHGFWIELTSLSSGSSPILAKVSPEGNAITAKFTANSVSISFALPQASPVSVKIFDMKGNLVGTPWTDYAPAGQTNHLVDFASLSTQPMLLTIQAGSYNKTYQFESNLIK